jgi:hypothetical protein
MAFNLTYDTSDDPMALEAEQQRDQESYEIGERLEQEQDNLLAGKFRDAEELENAYIELQRKLGSRDTEAEVEPDSDQEPEQAEEEEDDSPADYSFLNQLAQEADGGEFSTETLNALEQMSSADIADMFLSYRAEVQDQTPTAEPMSADDITAMKGLVGGDEEYTTMMTWASQNLAPQDIELYDAVMDRGDPQAIFFAVQALNYRYQDSVGYEGRMLTGRAAQTQDGYRSQAEVVRAMSDPRYEKDPAYRQDVFDKLDRSDLNF